MPYGEIITAYFQNDKKYRNSLWVECKYWNIITFKVKQSRYRPGVAKRVLGS
jgi:hypothetical protein